MITNDQLNKVQEILDIIIEDYKKKAEPEKRDWRTYEQQLALRLKTAIKELNPLIEEAAKSIKVVKGETRGTKPKITIKQKVQLLLLKHLVGHSNREMSNMLAIYSILADVDVSYKTVERLYSDELVQMVLHNMYQLILKKKNVKDADCSGDGTGYSLSISSHYRTIVQKLKDEAKTQTKKREFVYSFKLLDLNTSMYLSYGTSMKSEQDAYQQAIRMAKELDIPIKSIRLDKLYSAQAYVDQLVQVLGVLNTYILPKSSATIKGSLAWKRMLKAFITDTLGFLKEYYQRNQSESSFSEDKRRFGWKIAQRRNDRIDTADFLTTIWHNLLHLT